MTEWLDEARVRGTRQRPLSSFRWSRTSGVLRPSTPVTSGAREEPELIRATRDECMRLFGLGC